MGLRFEKWQALGNDYVIVERDALPFELTAERVRRICAPHFGCHSDGVLLLSRPSDDRFVAELRIFNPDGSEAELSGNGAREAILYLRRAGLDRATTRSRSRRAAGPVTPTITSRAHVQRRDGPGAASASADFPSGGPDGRGHARGGRRELEFQHVSIGNPQCVIEVRDELEALDLRRSGRRSSAASCSRTARTSRSSAIDSEHRVRARIFERGVGETLSSGTGASASAVAAVLRGAAVAGRPSRSTAASSRSR